MLKFKLFALVITCVFVCDQHTVAVIRPSGIIHVSNGFYAYVDNGFVVKKCWLRPDPYYNWNNKILIDLNSTTPIQIWTGTSILPFSPTVCGVRANASSNYINKSIMFEAETSNVTEQAEMRINVEKEEQFVTEIAREIGPTTIVCNRFKEYSRRCRIVDDKGDRWDQCELLTTIRSNRTFDCYVKTIDLKKSHEHIIVTVKNSWLVRNDSMEETDTSIFLRCQFDIKRKLSWCQAELPDHKTDFDIRIGEYDGRYSAYDSDTLHAKCAIEIPKPLKAHEMGLWRIVNYESMTPSGCLFYVGQDKAEIIEKELKSVKNKVINFYEPETETGAERNISAIVYMLPFAVEACYIRDPNNVVYFPQHADFPENSLYGNCTIVNLPIIPGMWQFGAFALDMDVRVLRDVEVNVKPRAGEALTTSVRVRKNQNAILECRSSFDDPIAYCLFVDPHNRVHLLATARKTKTNGHLQYHGRGLAYGDCGILINDVNGHDFGKWQCQFQVISYDNASVFDMHLIETLDIFYH